jgi:hypothetical protein
MNIHFFQTTLQLITDFTPTKYSRSQNMVSVDLVKYENHSVCVTVKDWKQPSVFAPVKISCSPKKGNFFEELFLVGKQQCMDGFDEDYCHQLEFNECEDDEYRCSNGMCVPGEYWLDGDYDCMDWSDEKYDHRSDYNGRSCVFHSNFDCDERLCLSDTYSCGDGQCLLEKSRFSMDSKTSGYCLSLRDINYMCELGFSYDIVWWTIKNGYCSPYVFKYLRSGWHELDKACDFYIKCALTSGLDEDCECNATHSCGDLFKAMCTQPYIRFPSQGAILTPYLDMFISREHEWQIKAPDRLLFISGARLKCVGYQAISDRTIHFPYEPSFYSDFYKFMKIDNLLCSNTKESFRNYSGPQYDNNCWVNATAFTKKPYQVFPTCPHRCLSKYRIRDGIRDCPHIYNHDEVLNSSCMISSQQHYRFHCSSSELSCLMPLGMGDSYSTCNNERDEMTPSGLLLTDYVQCWERNDKDCLFLRDYIRQSLCLATSYDTHIHLQDNTALTTLGLPFQRYCDSFFDTDDGSDESNRFCQQWVCRIDQYRCSSGQCISPKWICDGERLTYSVSSRLSYF